ncbi:E3 SUMO-protein ligase KIAA1586 homolog [Suricata suricatta]|uniref:E3 SUMO-protein ligase KIAA1586 homolog n=1 Tax=Suricata suricatta TaxID=37032 RepID=UPI001155D96D|nr:E3 SUMO-protein ligase KIAA1586 homolog [Suricata suricatta]
MQAPHPRVPFSFQIYAGWALAGRELQLPDSCVARRRPPNTVRKRLPGRAGHSRPLLLLKRFRTSFLLGLRGAKRCWEGREGVAATAAGTATTAAVAAETAAAAGLSVRPSEKWETRGRRFLGLPLPHPLNQNWQEGPSKPILEYVDLVSGDDEEPSPYHSDILFPKIPKRQGDFLHILNVKKVKTDTERNNSKNHCGLSKSEESNFKCVEQSIIEENPSCSSKEDIDYLVLPDCWNEKQAFIFTEQYKWLEIKEDMNMNTFFNLK